MALSPTSSIETYLSLYKSQSFKMDDCFYTEYMSDTKVKLFNIEENISNNYKEFLSSMVETWTFSNEEYRKYHCNPWYLSDDLYGTTELWFMLLHVNEMYSATEFTKRTIKYYNPNITKYITEISSVQDEFLKDNRADIYNTKRSILEGTIGMWD